MISQFSGVLDDSLENRNVIADMTNQEYTPRTNEIGHYLDPKLAVVRCCAGSVSYGYNTRNMYVLVSCHADCTAPTRRNDELLYSRSYRS